MDYRQVVIDYVEGRIPFDDFYAQVNTDDAMATWIDQNVPSNWRYYTKATAENNYTP